MRLNKLSYTTGLVKTEVSVILHVCPQSMRRRTLEPHSTYTAKSVCLGFDCSKPMLVRLQ